MTLKELDARFFRVERRWNPDVAITNPVIVFHTAERVEEADGVQFLVPGQKMDECRMGSLVTLDLFFRGKALEESGPRWDYSGTGLDDLTLSPGIDCYFKCRWWHGFVRDGEVVERLDRSVKL
jgi:hypothetical protein